MYLLADQQYIHSAEIEVVVEWECSKSIVGRMITSVELHTMSESQFQNALRVRT